MNCQAGFCPPAARSVVTVPGSDSFTRTIAPCPEAQLSAAVTASSPESERHATSHARIDGVTPFGVPIWPFDQPAVKIRKSDRLAAPQFATIATWVPSGANAAYRTPSPAFLPCILSVISPCHCQSTGLEENGFADVYSPSSVWF